MNRHVDVGPVTLGNDLPVVLIAGPCQIESRAHALETAAVLAEMCVPRGIGLIYKSSFDKANRTSAGSPRGLGLARGVEALAEVRGRYGCPVLTDVHERHQCAPGLRSTSRKARSWRRGT
jgi:2-dehydro-3-deoxyphosphooctonate aldolase (KDO 8-P synthase)